MRTVISYNMLGLWCVEESAFISSLCAQCVGVDLFISIAGIKNKVSGLPRTEGRGTTVRSQIIFSLVIHIGSLTVYPNPHPRKWLSRSTLMTSALSHSLSQFNNNTRMWVRSVCSDVFNYGGYISSLASVMLFRLQFQTSIFYLFVWSLAACEGFVPMV